jgi:hypothetical protein
MNLVSILAMSVKVGDPVTVDGLTSRGTVVAKKGKRVTVQVQDWRGGVGYRNGYRVERDESAVHKLGKGPGEWFWQVKESEKMVIQIEAEASDTLQSAAQVASNLAKQLSMNVTFYYNRIGYYVNPSGQVYQVTPTLVGPIDVGKV